MESDVIDDDKSINGNDENDSDIIRECEQELNEILMEGKSYDVSELENSHMDCGSEKRLEKRKEREEDDAFSEDGFVTIVRRKAKRYLRSDSIEQSQTTHGTISEEIGNIYEVCITSSKELPKQMAMAKLLRNENIYNITRIKYKSPFKVLIRFDSDSDADKLINCQKFRELEYKCQKTFDSSMCYGLIRGVDLEFSEKDILDVLKSEVNILAIRRLKRLDLEGKWVDSETMRICFQGTELPQYVTAYECYFNVDRYVFPVTQCSGCWEFGHNIKFCPKKKMLCPKCGSKDHINCEIKTFRCLNCKGLHFVLDKTCPMYRKEKEVRELMSRENIPYRQALQMVNDVKKQVIKKINLTENKKIYNSQDIERRDTQACNDAKGRSYSQVLTTNQTGKIDTTPTEEWQ
ncbi:uncharacterized protein LOC128202241 [Galleria mellonella]|uniref:Uncharacterized protein LOC128202241 n=1 Tax=Galleria mellonella TaxID=7137 RepID=A0ABM3N2H0_GALME|nr:uncharacterized protein LOC128202241 [Galleria mellonella]